MRTPEHQRLEEAAQGRAEWKKWGPYLAERQWGTVREDYSVDGDPWRYFTHDQARSRVYHWGEDGLAGLSDDQQLLCFALALWNGADPILKERLFGLTNAEGNHGEDVKECYYYLDATPTSSYLKFLYKYPQAAFPYDALVAVNAGRDRSESEYELMDTGVFAGGRYFDVVVEYAKDSPEDILIAISVTNRGPEAATLCVLPTLWFRNTWSWSNDVPKPNLKQVERKSPISTIAAVHAELGVRYLYCEGAPLVLFTENETNNRRLFGGDNGGLFVKDGINDYVVTGVKTAINMRKTGTKAAARYDLAIEPGETRVLRLRLADGTPASSDRRGGPFAGFDPIVATRRAEADAFYATIVPAQSGSAAGETAPGETGPGNTASGEDAAIIRQALAGMLWNRQYYHYDVGRWLAEHRTGPGRDRARAIRNAAWSHVDNADIISMPDKWEYPWYAAWDLPFHCVPLALVDGDFAKRQLDLLLQPRYLHPNGQLGASEWDFAAVGPPVHAWAAWSVYSLDKARRGGAGDLPFLRVIFARLLMNYTWWLNRKDTKGRDLFAGGVLGIDDLGVFDHRETARGGSAVETSTAIGWMAFSCLHMLRLAIELAADDAEYEPFAEKFFAEFVAISAAMERVGANATALWNDTDGFFHDVIESAEGNGATTLGVRAMAGLIPLCAGAVVSADMLNRLPRLEQRFRGLIEAPLGASGSQAVAGKRGYRDRKLLSAVSEDRLVRTLTRMLDESEFLSPFGIRSLSQAHRDPPLALPLGGKGEFGEVAYQPGEAHDALLGGNANWRGPVWFPYNALLIDGLLQQYLFHGNRLRVECPTGSGQKKTLFEIAEEITRRLAAIFRRDDTGRRPVFGDDETLQTDPHWRDHLLFHEYFHGEDGTGLGASHQTGWTGLIAPLLRFFANTTAEEFLEFGSEGGFLSSGRKEAWPTSAGL